MEINTYVKIFRGYKVELLSDEANVYGENRSSEIVSAQLSFYGSGKTYEEAILTVVYKKTRDRKSKKANEDKVQ